VQTLTISTTTYPAGVPQSYQNTYGPMPEAQAQAKVAGWAAHWRALGYAVREGDGWATGATAEFTVAVYAALTADEMEAAEAAAEAQWDGWKNGI
jgi:hypothetical protein